MTDVGRAFKEAARRGDTHMVASLLEDVVNPVVRSMAMEAAAQHGHVDVVKLLLESGQVDPAVQNNFPIRVASRGGHIAVVSLLLKSDLVDPAAANNDAISQAAYNGHAAVVEKLLDSNSVDPGVYNNQAIRYAAQKGYIETVKLLLKSDLVNPADKNNEAIRWAAEAGHEDIVEILLRDNRVLAGRLPRPDLESNDPLAQYLGRVVLASIVSRQTLNRYMRSTHKPTTEYKLISKIMSYQQSVKKQPRDIRSYLI